MDEILPGGVGNAGVVIRVGDTVRRPEGPHGPQVRAYLQDLAATGFDGAVLPSGLDEQGREVAPFIPGDVPIPPYPAWSLTAEALESVARLVRRFHDASAQVPLAAGPWSSELADPSGGPMLVHNDICPENVVFQSGEAAALLDFEFAAPGSRAWDVVATARMWCPVGDPSTHDPKRRGLDPVERFGTFVRAYGADVLDAEELVGLLFIRREVGQAFVQRRMAAGEQAFVDMWDEMRLEERHRLDLEWLEVHRSDLVAAATGSHPERV